MKLQVTSYELQAKQKKIISDLIFSPFVHLFTRPPVHSFSNCNRKSKLSGIFLVLVFAFLFETYAVPFQQYEEIGYSYDLAGNRTGRKIIIFPPLPVNPGGNTGGDEETENGMTYAGGNQNNPQGSMSQDGGNYTNSGNYSTNPNLNPLEEDIITDFQSDVSENYFANNNGITSTVNETSYQNSEPDSRPMVDLLENRKVIIYPNPTKGQLKIEIQGEDTEQITVNLFDVTGKLAYSQTMIDNPMLVDISAQPNGTYILRIIEGERSSVWKIIKQ